MAAPTTSLPEQPGGGGRNWVYRYTWIRDAAFSLYALLRLGFTQEAEAFMSWLTERFREGRSTENGPLQIMYGIDGRTELPEEVLGHLEGYCGRGPVRVGNAAAEQLQLDMPWATFRRPSPTSPSSAPPSTSTASQIDEVARTGQGCCL